MFVEANANKAVTNIFLIFKRGESGHNFQHANLRQNPQGGLPKYRKYLPISHIMFLLGIIRLTLQYKYELWKK